MTSLPPAAFADELAAIREADMWLSNSEFQVDEGDPRNLDPDDELLAELSAAASAMEEAALDLQEAIRKERNRRENVLDEMEEGAYKKWQASVDALNADC